MKETKMYNVCNKANTYFIYDRTNDRLTKIGDYKDLTAYVASRMIPNRPYWKRRVAATENEILRDIQWRNSFIREQNLTGKDTYDICHTEKRLFVRTTAEGNIEPYYSYYNIHTEHIKPYTILDGNGRTIDARTVLPDAIRLLTQDTFNFETQLRKNNHWHPYAYRTAHVCYQGSHGTSKRTRIQHEICNELDIPYRAKADRFKRDWYWGTPDNRTSSGWKHTKDKHQWEHNIRNKNQWRNNSPKNYWLAEQERQFAEFEQEEFDVANGAA